MDLLQMLKQLSLLKKHKRFLKYIDTIAEEEFCAETIFVVRTLNEKYKRERTIILLRTLGLTYKEISGLFFISIERTRQIHNKGIRIIQNRLRKEIPKYVDTKDKSIHKGHDNTIPLCV